MVRRGTAARNRELLPAKRVDTFVDLFPEVCLGCTRALPRVVDVAACRYQQLELRDHRPHVTEWRRHEVVCDHCGASTRAAYHSAQIPSSAFGACLTAVVALLTGAYHLSRRKTQKLLGELFGIAVSLGAISAMEQRASEALKTAHQEALREVQYAGIKHSDATSWTRSGKLMSLWTLASTAATVYQIFTDGCRDTVRPLFGSCIGILVSDRATVFSFWSMTQGQSHASSRIVSSDIPYGTVRELLVMVWRAEQRRRFGFPEAHLDPVQVRTDLIIRGPLAAMVMMTALCRGRIV